MEPWKLRPQLGSVRPATSFGPRAREAFSSSMKRRLEMSRKTRHLIWKQACVLRARIQGITEEHSRDILPLQPEGIYAHCSSSSIQLSCYSEITSPRAVLVNRYDEMFVDRTDSSRYELASFVKSAGGADGVWCDDYNLLLEAISCRSSCSNSMSDGS